MELDLLHGIVKGYSRDIEFEVTPSPTNDRACSAQAVLRFESRISASVNLNGGSSHRELGLLCSASKPLRASSLYSSPSRPSRPRQATTPPTGKKINALNEMKVFHEIFVWGCSAEIAPFCNVDENHHFSHPRVFNALLKGFSLEFCIGAEVSRN